MFLRLDPSMVQRLLISYRYLEFFASIASACLLLRRRPEYSTMKVRFAIGAVANRPRPVRERPIRNSFLLRGMQGNYTRIRTGAIGRRTSPSAGSGDRMAVRNPEV